MFEEGCELVTEGMDSGRVTSGYAILGELEEKKEEFPHVGPLEVSREQMLGGEVDGADGFVDAVVVRCHLGCQYLV